MQHKKFHESEGLASLSRALRASHQKVPQPDAVEITDSAQLDGPSKPRKAKRHADMQTAGDAAGAKAKKTRKKVKQPREDAAKDEHVQQAAHPHSEEREADGLPEPRQVHAVHRQVVKDIGTSHEEEHEQDPGAPAATTAAPPTRTFRDVFVDMFTSAFSTDLYDLQQVEGEALHLPLLLRCIEQGSNLFSDIEKDLLCRQEGAAAST